MQAGASSVSVVELGYVKAEVLALARRIQALSGKEQKQVSMMCHERLVARPVGAGKSWKPSTSGVGILPFPHPAMIFTNQVPQVGVFPQELPSVSQSVQAFHFEELFNMMGDATMVPPPATIPSENTVPTEDEVPGQSLVDEQTPVAKTEAAAAPKMVKAVKLTSFPSENKIKVIKEIRQLLGLGLKEAKDASENLPRVLAKQVPRDEANGIVARFAELDAEITME
ncbi:ribosomal protein L7/L12, putative [Perkinsus marinus ATCC 50983]|uniref:Ribosomal protein L7/L12, putative n=1 Tax=Perkinsus marinus (strain ATCC 50983 / TXsc) TaxID=423536 RepID=C5M0A6_PERM5|nr:ribosomal protein L7/L12, putative [Perkinsus marinus ATCC 50983]EEQ97595.1 ribosomal protein L7/L12, putative [Perkinsus marinus ATCC 50983]|eukprot:XP_002764878.1 ribosomal protein L7/L12, putative [Perkinsus marinus ATCC 50983]